MNDIRYKVVTEERQSIVAKQFYTFVLSYASLKPVSAISNTVGIFVFNHKAQAIKYADRLYKPRILEVRGIGKGKLIQACFDLRWYNNTFSTLPNSIPELFNLPIKYLKISEGLSFFCKGYRLWKCPTGSMVYPAVFPIT